MPSGTGTADALLRAPGDVLGRLRRDVERNALRARNGIKLVTGTDRPRSGLTPKDVVWERDRAKMYRYRSDQVAHHPPLLIVHSLVSKAYILDLAPGNSLVERLRDEGFDVFLLDWGIAEDRDSGNGLEDYAERYIPSAIERVREVTGSEDVALFGYCFGGVLSLLTAAANPDLPLASLTVAACPVDYTKMGPMAEIMRRGEIDLDGMLDDDGNVPPSLIRQSFTMLKPTGELASYANLLDNLWDDRMVNAHQLMTQWAADHVPFPGRAAGQSAQMLMRDNAFMTDTLRIGGRRASLKDITVPFLNIVAERDHIVPVDAAAPGLDLVGSSDKAELRLDAGHVGLFVGGRAQKVTIPKIADFLRKRSRPVQESHP